MPNLDTLDAIEQNTDTTVDTETARCLYCGEPLTKCDCAGC